MNKTKVFKMPVAVKITGRKSSIINNYYNWIIPSIEPGDDEVKEALNTLGMTEDTICCAYCGDTYTEWDHLNPLIKNKEPTGYITEIYNLVPACGKCNQSKGNKYWKEWMQSDAALSPKTRNIPDLDERISRLDEYVQKYEPRRYDFKAIVGDEKWEQLKQNCEDIQRKLAESQKLSDELREKIKETVNSGTGFSGPAIGTVLPGGTKIKRRPDGLISFILPKDAEKRINNSQDAFFSVY